MKRNSFVKWAVVQKINRLLTKQFFKFGIVGIGNTIVSMAAYYIVLCYNPDLYMLGSILGAILSIFHAFLWSNFYVFPQKNQTIKSFLFSLIKCYISYGGTSLLSNVLLWFEVSFCSLSKIYAPIVNLFITIPLNFLLNKIWVFGRSKGSDFHEG